MNTIQPSPSAPPTRTLDTPRAVAPASAQPQAGMAPDRIERSKPDSLGSQLAHGLRSVSDFLLGNDLQNAFGPNKTLGQRTLGVASLASNFVPIGKVAGLGIKAAEHIAIGVGTHAVEHAAADGVTHAVEKTVALAAQERARLTAIAKGEHTIAKVDGKTLAHPSQDLVKIEALEQKLGEPHTNVVHVAKNDSYLEARLQEPLRRSDGSVVIDHKTGNPRHRPVASTFTDGRTAQEAVNNVIADPMNQRKIGDWLASGARNALPLRGNFGKVVGSGIRRTDLLAGKPQHFATSEIKVVLKADENFPEGYKILTTYPDVKL